MRKRLLNIFIISALCVIMTGCGANSAYINKNVETEDINKKIENIKNESLYEDQTSDTIINNSVLDSNLKDSGDNTTNLEDEIKANSDKVETSSDNLIVEVVETSTTALSNKTCAWGFRRMKDHVQPEFTASYTKPLDDYQGIYVGNSGESVIYLTFDEGYENGYTTTILDTLKEKEVTAVFFVTMPYVKQNPELIRRMIDEGHIVGNHTVNHPSMPSVTDDEKLKKEIMDLHNYVLENFDYEMTFLRPPKGEYSERTLAIARDLGYRTVLWSSAYADWDVNNQKGSEYAKGMILDYIHNGCVMLLHAVSKDNDAVLGDIIDEIRGRGYEFLSLNEFEY